MIVLAIVGTIVAVIWSFMTLWANAMSDAPMAGFQGVGMLIAIWCAVLVLWLAWYFK